MHRRSFLAGLAATLPNIAFASGAPATATRPFMRNAETIIRAAGSSARLLEPALSPFTSFVLYDPDQNTVLDAYQPNLELPPASVTKAITAVYARDTLGPDFRFSTQLLATGPVNNGIVQGDLYLVGNGDPLLDTDELAELARSAIANGIRGITGRFYVDGSRLPNIPEIDPSQPDHLGYNPAISGLNLNFNRVYFEWKQAQNDYDLRLEARGEKYNSAVSWVNISTANRDLPVFEHSIHNGHDRWSVARSALGREGGRWLPVRQPIDYAAEVFTSLASHAGLRLPAATHNNAPRNATVVASFESAHMDEIIRWLLKYSNNLTAECIGLAASQKLGVNPDTLIESAQHMSRWSQVNLGADAVGFRNHSGLTDQALVSSLDMVKMFASERSQYHLDGLLKPISISDQKDAQPIVFAKTGSLNFTRALAGYLQKGQRRLCFSIICADMQRRSAIPMNQRERPRGAKSWSGAAKHQERMLLQNWAQYLG